MEFSYVLKQLRDEKGLSQKDIADYLGITRQAVAFYEVGKREPDYQILKKLADYFSVSIDYLLGRAVCKDINALTIASNINLVREEMSYKKMSEAIAKKTGALIPPEMLEAYCKGERIPFVGTLKILAMYGGVRESFFYVQNTKEKLIEERELGRKEKEKFLIEEEIMKIIRSEPDTESYELKKWAVSKENIEYIKLAKDVKDSGMHPEVFRPLIESFKSKE